MSNDLTLCISFVLAILLNQSKAFDTDIIVKVVTISLWMIFGYFCFRKYKELEGGD